ncbi:SAM-dependent methyltransferase [Lipingzhangella sp. LS1_29]|uniref:SAM-dependent methyltransferase n=1 Tax=Lipingzhangella rawalii TaxID=2055835 RepID=A0ABU2H774_9ACTN|nr:SAM-dependent methyltransferase [Lipingzhangella rawalii]MDS1270665.1 SAM-dependent methyltransferase [Lipingzhangella rawalii]
MSATGDEFGSFPPEVPTDRPTSARVYAWALGGKDTFAVDREWSLKANEVFPEGVDMARNNRQFLYRAVRFLARDAGIEQFLDLGSGLPTENNVHQVAQQFQPGARVVYVDNDPIVSVHGRALLAEDNSTTVIDADMTSPDEIFAHPETRRLIDLTQPVGILMFSIPHCIPDDAAARRAIQGPVERAASGSYLAITHVAANDPATAQRSSQTLTDFGMPWKTRTPTDIDPWLAGLDPVAPGLGDITDWRPDPDQPELSPLPPELQPFLGASQRRKELYEYGGVLRKP